MKLTAETLQQIAEDAAIKLDGAEVDYYLDELNKVITLFEQIKTVDIPHIKPAYTITTDEYFLQETKVLQALLSDYVIMPQTILE
ncbi:MAG: Asp-tRNA(Asn)/Glu-tRNA(Gln) amidotransferase subunit GatC [Cellulosilyticaceae bacterium]